ncbi:GNAT family N-acetyltransferase [Haladaptatus cibarius]|uniref:GNAT family N-acetyltransferase n=1 Tax=Haladaptatus cibarius TaxID=453847 RepID=UPI0006787E9D|nr:GNAT family N-acetyltransferase [Haladaptatus cibarius]
MSDDHQEVTPTLGPGATIRSNYVFQRYDRTIERTISFRPATMERDLGRLHTWLGYDHVAEFWTLDISLPAFRDHLAGKLAEDHLTPYIGYIDHVPMSYWEVYWPSEYELDAYYDADPADRAAHLLIGPPEYVNSGYAKALFRAMGIMLFSHPETKRVVGEPEADNEVVLHVLEQCGFEARKEFYFEEADKDALLMVCERDGFEEALLADSPATVAQDSTDE